MSREDAPPKAQLRSARPCVSDCFLDLVQFLVSQMELQFRRHVVSTTRRGLDRLGAFECSLASRFVVTTRPVLSVQTTDHRCCQESIGSRQMHIEVDGHLEGVHLPGYVLWAQLCLPGARGVAPYRFLPFRQILPNFAEISLHA